MKRFSTNNHSSPTFDARVRGELIASNIKFTGTQCHRPMAFNMTFFNWQKALERIVTDNY